MPKSKVEEYAEIVARYLEQKDVEWEACRLAKGQCKPTLPFTNDMKVNVLGMVREMGLRDSIANNYFHKAEYRKWFADPVNVIARVQGLKGIGSRLLDDGSDDLAMVAVDRLSSQVSAQSAKHAQANARVAQLERKNAELSAENERLRRRLDHVQATGGFIRTGELFE